MKRTWVLCLLVGIICVSGTVFITDRYFKPDAPEPPSGNFKELVEHIDSLNNEIVGIKRTNDSLSGVIDTTKQKIIINNEEYKQRYIDITNQSIGDDIKFFTNYLSKSNPGFSNSNNSETIKAN